MNITEFKIWLEGYSQSFKNGKPSKKQWAAVQEKLLSVSEKNPFDKLVYPYPANLIEDIQAVPRDRPNYAPVWVWNEPATSSPSLKTQVIC